MLHSRYFLPSLLCCLAPALALANNILVSNVTLTGKNTINDTYQVKFDLSWENSWRTSSSEANYDAAWIFIKYRIDPGTVWAHALLSSTGHVQPAGGTIQVPTDLTGAFLYRSADGIGNVSFTSSQLQWNYGAGGVADNALVEVQVLAIEMVYIPQGPFVVGDGSTTNIERQFELAQSGAPFQITSEAAITLGGSGATNLNTRNNVASSGNTDDFNYITTQTLPAAFPKGFNAFYAMKYECTEGQYVDFLNMLTATQATARFPNQTGTALHTIDDTGAAPEPYVTAAPERACNFIDGNDMCAYADWAGLRPMTELEFEKTCRGSRPAVANEYAWGSTSVRTAPIYTMSNPGAANESVNALGTQGNASYGSVAIGNLGPWRAGIFSGSLAAPSREAAGAGYYGAMELSGNLYEAAISVGRSDGRIFTGLNGDGLLNASGDANVGGWPSPTSLLALARRGSAWAYSSVARMRVSDRVLSNSPMATVAPDYGMRLCRLP